MRPPIKRVGLRPGDAEKLTLLAIDRWAAFKKGMGADTLEVCRESGFGDYDCLRMASLIFGTVADMVRDTADQLLAEAKAMQGSEHETRG